MKKRNDAPVARAEKAQRLALGEGWESAVGRALGKKRPADGWPKPEPKVHKKRAKVKRRSK